MADVSELGQIAFVLDAAIRTDCSNDAEELWVTDRASNVDKQLSIKLYVWREYLGKHHVLEK